MHFFQPHRSCQITVALAQSAIRRLKPWPYIKLLLVSFGIASSALPGWAGPSLGLGVDIVYETADPMSFPLVTGDVAAPLFVEDSDYPGVLRAAKDLQADVERVTDSKPKLVTNRNPSGKAVVLVGTLGKSKLIDQLSKSGKIQVREIAGKWESFLITTVPNPLPGVDQALVVAGSDKRGTIYGLYEIAEQIGVSPWYWWADVPPQRRKDLFVKAGTHVQGPPAVKYRGIFINDEEPALGNWSREQFGGVNSKMYKHMFELILRLRGNYLWPAMWGKSIYEDDPESARLADEYGVVLGTSHHEPMTRAHVDWSRHRKDFGNGAWNYATNEESLQRFWSEGIKRNKDNETVITIGMRGDGDEPMIEGGDMAANIALLEKIVADQQEIISREMGVDPATTPRLWALYKEVKDYYDHGMRVPDDITLLWCDDNWGNIRRLPTPEERKRSGGAGIYYHFDYVGSPRCYKWINTNPLPKIWEQMNMAYEYDANEIWVVNVGDLKPMEIPIEFFLRMAWDPKAMPKERIAEFTQQWATREFGAEYAKSIADIVSKYAKYNAWRKPELLEPDTFSLVNYREAERVLAAWQEIVVEAERINDRLPPEHVDAFFQLVLYPTKASATIVEMYLAAGRNSLYAAQGRGSTNDQAERVRELFQQDQQLTNAYHRLADGKWNHMMAQTRVGYTSWRDPRENIMPKVVEVTPEEMESLGVAIEGSEASWPGGSTSAVLPAVDSINRQRRWIDVFRRGSKNFDYSITASKPWVRFSESSGTVGEDQRIWVEVDWEKVPVGEHRAEVMVSRIGGSSVTIQLDTVRSGEFTSENVEAFGGLTGPTAISAEDAKQNVAAGDVRWERIPDYGRGPSGMAVFPTIAQSVIPPEDSPRLEYPVLIADAGEVQVDLITGIALNVQPDRGVRIAVSFDDQAPRILDAFEGRTYAKPSERGDRSAPPIRGWHDWVRDNARTLHSTHKIESAGIRTLKVWMVDPGVVLEKIVVHTGDVRPSYFGPPLRGLPPGKPTPDHAAYAPWNENGRIAHRQLLEKARSGKIDLYFLGDSITRRWGATDYPKFLDHFQRSFFGWNAANFGWGGDSTHHILWRLKNGELDGIDPKVIVLLAGTNNIGDGSKSERVDDTVAGIAAILEVCQSKAPQAKIILMAIFPRNDSAKSNAQIVQINRRIAKFADGDTVRFLDITDQLADEHGQLLDGVTVDKLHLSLNGYEVWAKNLMPHLTELLGPRGNEDFAPPPTGDPSAAQKSDRN